MKKLIFVLILTISYYAGWSQVSKNKGTKTATATNPEVYHLVDPQVVGFKLKLNFTSVTVSSDQEMVSADVDSAFIDNEGNPYVEGKLFPFELVTNHITNGLLKTEKFGQIKLKSDRQSMEVHMTNKQVALIKKFLGR